MKDKLLTVAIELAAKKGLREATRNGVARAAGVSSGSVSYHFKSARKLLAAVVAAGIEARNMRIVADALAAQHPLALKMPQELKTAAARFLAASA